MSRFFDTTLHTEHNDLLTAESLGDKVMITVVQYTDESGGGTAVVVALLTPAQVSVLANSLLNWLRLQGRSERDLKRVDL